MTLRNIALIAHVDHGKTTLVDQLLRQSGTLGRGEGAERIMDSDDLERERGITILSKNTAIDWRDPRDGSDYRINIVDTPGHADFGGEVERVLSMVDSVLLLVDAVEGPMPQTRFVTRKAFALGFRPIVVINKVDRDGARPDWVLNQTFDLFDSLGADDHQLDFPVVYCSALRGQAATEPAGVAEGADMTPLFTTIVDRVPAPDAQAGGPFQMSISSLDYSSYVGVIGIGRIARGRVRPNSPVVVIDRGGNQRNARVLQVLGFMGLERVEVDEAAAGDIVAVTGVAELGIADTLCDREAPEAVPHVPVDEPTISMQFWTNDSPLAGQEGRFITSRQVQDRLYREASHNVALRVEPTDNPDRVRVAGRGELHLAILLENMRREGYEVAISRPRVVLRETDAGTEEPWELLVVTLDSGYQGAVMEALGERRAELRDMVPEEQGRVRMEFTIPARGLIGFQNEFRTITSGTGAMHHVFDHWGARQPGSLGGRRNGVLIAKESGQALAYALFNLQERGRLFIGPGETVYEGQIVGIHSRPNDLTVNPLKGKQLSNVRAAGKDENVVLTPALRLTLEQAMEFIADDELVEVTPTAIRLRKKLLSEQARKRARHETAAAD